MKEQFRAVPPFDWDARLTRPATIQTYGYLRSCCGERSMPRREDLDPRMWV